MITVRDGFEQVNLLLTINKLPLKEMDLYWIRRQTNSDDPLPAWWILTELRRLGYAW